MRRLVPLAVVAALSSLATAAVIVLPALAVDDGGKQSWALRDANRPFAAEFARFAECMRDKGFAFDGDVRVEVDGDRITVDGKEVDADAFREAERACGGPPFQRLRDLPALRGLPPLRDLPGRDELRAQRDAFLEDVAERLGIDVERLKDALRGAAIARIDALERAGRIDAAHADALRELARAGGLPLLGSPPLTAPHGRPGVDRLELLPPRPA
jgi:hypothetical protein